MYVNPSRWNHFPLELRLKLLRYTSSSISDTPNRLR